MLRACKRLVLQYVIVRPVLTFVAVILHAFDKYCPGSTNPKHGYIYLEVLDTISISTAMYILIQFYVLVNKEISSYHPVSKFLAVKFVIFMLFWQGVGVSLLGRLGLYNAGPHWSKENISEFIQNSMVCLEMMIAAIWHLSAFSHHEFEKPNVRTKILPSLMDVVSPKDLIQDVETFHPKKIAKK
eukprot:TRINITY_DN14940_c0_g1_i1.p1 TRINITY_DN14940_c0_g1~~TRINITY_DN14940_c0_g1_i1.p1  ORF type:complete len:185 (-),score=29.61 TRINITY_DN14940_c0_g1_i1:21-575(-)